MDSSEGKENWCKTQNKIANFDFTWTIEKFSFCSQELGKCLRSSTFSANQDDQQQPKWRLDLYPKGSKEESKDYVALFLLLDKKNQTTEPVCAKFKFCLVKANGEHTNVKKSPEAVKFEQGKRGWGYNFIRRDFLLNPQNGLLPNDQLSIFCEVSIVVETVNLSSQIETPVPQSRLENDMGALLEGSSFSDCVLCSGDGKEFQVHKGVLACRSPVFAAMFEHAMEEKRTNKVNIPDISAPVLGQLLHFLYTGCAPKLLAEQEMAGELLVAADKYQLNRLKALCERQLSKGLNKDNVCDVLALADLHSAEHLKSRAIEYIKFHEVEVLENEGWRTLVASNPELLKLVLKSKAPNTANQIPPNRETPSSQ